MKPTVMLALAIALCGTAFANGAAGSFAPGQTWTYHARPDPANSRLHILRVEDFPREGRVVHVSIVGLALHRKPGGSPEGWNIAHAAFAEASLRDSVIDLDPLLRPSPDAAERTYRRWKKRADRGNVQKWTVPVTRVIGEIERQVLGGRG
jgi:hypothetical protein